MVRPRKDLKCTKHSISLSPESEEVIERLGYKSNLSAFINDLIHYNSTDSPIIMGIKIERLTKDIAMLEEKLLSMRTERDIFQAKLNLYKHHHTTEEQTLDDARMDILRKWEKMMSKGNSQNLPQFAGWLSGPANMYLMKKAGFSTIDEVIEWCRKEANR